MKTGIIIIALKSVSIVWFQLSALFTGLRELFKNPKMDWDNWKLLFPRKRFREMIFICFFFITRNKIGQILADHTNLLQRDLKYPWNGLVIRRNKISRNPLTLPHQIFDTLPPKGFHFVIFFSFLPTKPYNFSKSANFSTKFHGWASAENKFSISGSRRLKFW